MVRVCCLALAAFAFNQCSGSMFSVQEGKYIGVYDDTNTYSWAGAVVHCELMYGTTLASIHSANDENEAAQARYLGDNEAWVGLTDQDIEGHWQWVDGSTYDYDVSWASGEPNDWQGEDCVQVVSNVVYEGPNATTIVEHNDVPCTWEHSQFICNAPDMVEDSEEDSSVSKTLKVIENDMLFIPLMIVSSILFICTVAMVSGICYYLICWRRKPKFEMLENERLTNDTDGKHHHPTTTIIAEHGDHDHDHDEVDDDDNQLNDDDLADARDHDDTGSDEPHGNGVKADDGDDQL